MHQIKIVHFWKQKQFEKCQKQFEMNRIEHLFHKDPKFLLVGREHWSSGYGRKLMLERFESLHLVRIPALNILDGHDIFHIDLLLKLYCLFEKTENK